MKRSVLTLAALLIVTAMPAMVEAAVLCANPSGSIFVRTACKSGETALDPATLGLVGPPGPAGPRGEAGPAGPMGPIGATGSSGVSGWEQKTGHFECSNQSYCAGYLSCPAGKRLLGGGAYYVYGPGPDPVQVSINTSTPIDNATWFANAVTDPMTALPSIDVVITIQCSSVQ